MAANLTDASIRRLSLPAKGNKVHYDDEVAGFGVRITVAGARAFILNYRTKSGRERRYTIGACADWTTTDARKEAKRLRHLVDQGGDPLADLEAERTAPTVFELCDRFEREHLPRLRPSSQSEYRGMLAKYIRPHFTSAAKVADVSFADIDRLHRRITQAGHLTRANRVIAVTSKMFSLALRWSMRTDNPCQHVERNPETMRRRYVKSDGSDSELARLTAALTQHPDQNVADIVRLLLLTGARSGEVLSMRWADIDLGVGKWSKPAASTKQGQDHEVPLSAPARQLLSALREQQTSGRRVLGEYVFPGPGDSRHRVELKRAWRRICKAASISGLRIHDLRHSFASQLVSGGHSLPLIGALLGHSDPSTTQRYAHLFDDPQRAAVETIGALIGAAGQPAVEPTPLRRRP